MPLWKAFSASKFGACSVSLTLLAVVPLVEAARYSQRRLDRLKGRSLEPNILYRMTWPQDRRRRLRVSDWKADVQLEISLRTADGKWVPIDYFEHPGESLDSLRKRGPVVRIIDHWISDIRKNLGGTLAGEKEALEREAAKIRPLVSKIFADASLSGARVRSELTRLWNYLEERGYSLRDEEAANEKFVRAYLQRILRPKKLDKERRDRILSELGPAYKQYRRHLLDLSIPVERLKQERAVLLDRTARLADQNPGDSFAGP